MTTNRVTGLINVWNCFDFFFFDHCFIGEFSSCRPIDTHFHSFPVRISARYPVRSTHFTFERGDHPSSYSYTFDYFLGSPNDCATIKFNVCFTLVYVYPLQIAEIVIVFLAQHEHSFVSFCCFNVNGDVCIQFLL